MNNSLHEYEQDLYRRLQKQSDIIQSRKRAREEEQKQKNVKVLEKVTRQIEQHMEKGKTFMIISEEEHSVVGPDLASFFKIRKIARGNMLDHEEPVIEYIVDLVE
jgi:23S rRNA pseudoU1915 N3-methylase RlmH